MWGPGVTDVRRGGPPGGRHGVPEAADPAGGRPLHNPPDGWK